MHENGLVEFLFENILLPDSTTNEPTSHGFITYQIQPNPDISDFTTINNFAGIFFDFNDPIITNTVTNTMVTSFDNDEDGVFVWEDCDDMNAAVNMNMEEIPYDGIDNDCNELTLDDDFDEDGYGIADDCDDDNASINPGIMEIPYDGIDNDCNELTLDDDLDEDGFSLSEDCDDMNGSINPDAIEIPDNGIDEDCDGEDLVTSILVLEDASIQIFPNPTSDKISIQQENINEGYYYLHTSTGKIIQYAKLLDQQTINLKEYPSGLYFLTFYTDKGMLTQKLIKQ